ASAANKDQYNRFADVLGFRHRLLQCWPKLRDAGILSRRETLLLCGVSLLHLPIVLTGRPRTFLLYRLLSSLNPIQFEALPIQLLFFLRFLPFSRSPDQAPEALFHPAMSMFFFVTYL